jgi:predicted transcriptional regulator
LRKKKLTDKKKLMAYVLNKDEDFGYTMGKIGKMMGVSQSTISAAIKKEVTLRKQIYDLQTELNAMKAMLTGSDEFKNQNKFIQPINLIEE